jgi:hypothetical protein
MNIIDFSQSNMQKFICKELFYRQTDPALPMKIQVKKYEKQFAALTFKQLRCQ